ncbi:semaphorin-2A-like [Amblyomma americanum]
MEPGGPPRPESQQEQQPQQQQPQQQGQVEPPRPGGTAGSEQHLFPMAVHRSPERPLLSYRPLFTASCGLVALLVPGLLGSVLTLVALPGCLGGGGGSSEDPKGAPPKPPSEETGSTATSSTPSCTSSTSSSDSSPPAVGPPPVTVFTRGKLYYRSAYLNESGGHLYVGAMEKLFKLPLENITSQPFKELDLPAESGSVTRCAIYTGQLKLGKDVDCRNHVREVHPIRDGSTLYVCGTNARAPTDWQVQADDLTLVPVATQVPIGGNNQSEQAEGRCPFYVYQDSSSLWLGERYARRRRSREKQVFRCGPDQPHSVAAFSTSDHAYFVFSEEGLERKASGLKNVSTLARVCKVRR